MNKLTKLLSVFILAGAVGAGVAGVAGCTKKDDGNNGGGHTHNYTWVNDNNGKCHEHCGVAGCDLPDKPAQDHVDTKNNQTQANGADGKCDHCGATLTPSGALAAPAGATGIIVEYEGEDVELSMENKTASIDLAKVKVYFEVNSAKGAAVPAANYDVEVYKDGDPISTLTDLKQGNYEISVTLKNVTSGGSAVTWDNMDQFVITNPENVDTLAKSSTGDVTIEQGADDTMSSAWTFEVTLANGDKQAVAAKDITITGIDTATAGTKNATVTYKTKSIQVEYTVTAVEGMVTQSYAVNANTVEIGSNAADKVLNAAGKISLTAKSGKSVDIDANSKSIDGKSFVRRIKLGGSPIKSGALDGTTIFRTIKLEDVNATTVQGATSKTRITVYAASSSEGTARALNIYKEGGTAAAPTLTAVEGATCQFTTIAKHVYEITDTGTFHIASASGGINIYYVQVDKIMTGETGAEGVVLGGEMKPISLSLNTDEAKTVYKVGDTINTSNITATLTSANNVTADSATQSIENSDLVFDTAAFDNTQLGEYAINVTYGTGADAVSKSYNVTVESAVDGVKGVTAAVKSDLVTQVETDDGTVTVKSGDIVVSLVWTSDEVTGVTTEVVVKDGQEVIDATTGKAFAIGAHTLTVEITVKNADNTQTATFTKEVTLTVSKKVNAGDLQNVTIGSDEVKTLAATMTAETTIVDNANGKIFITADTTNTVTMDTNNKSCDSISFTHRIKLGGTGTNTYRSLGFEVKAGAKIVIYAMSSSSSDARTANLLDSTGAKIANTATSIPGSALAKYEFTVTTAGTYYFAAETGGTNVYGASIIYNAAA